MIYLISAILAVIGIMMVVDALTNRVEYNMGFGMGILATDFTFTFMYFFTTGVYNPL